MSDRVPMHNVDCPESSLRWDQLFAGEPRLRTPDRIHWQSRVLLPQQPRDDEAHFGKRISRHLWLLRPYPVPPPNLGLFLRAATCAIDRSTTIVRSVRIDFTTIASHRRDVAGRQPRTLSQSRRPGRAVPKNGKLMSETAHTLP